MNSTLKEIIPGILILFGIVISSKYSYLLYHSLVEIFSVVIAFSIFVITWNTRHLIDNNYLLFLGVAYFFVAAVDLLHTLAYKGMGVFVNFDANLPTQLWITARYIESLSLFTASFLIGLKRIKIKPIFIVLLVITSIALTSIFYFKIFPDCFIEGKGLTTFKRVSEYVICTILVVSLWLLMKKRHGFSKRVLMWLIGSIVTTIIQEIFFTFYVSVYDLSNFAGHVFKVISFYFLYKGIVEVGLKRPYEILWRQLKASEEEAKLERDRARHYLEIAGVVIVIIGIDKRVQLINRKGCEILGYSEEEIIGKNWFEHFIPEKDREKAEDVFLKIISGKIEDYEYFENTILAKDGSEKIISWHNTVIRGDNGQIIATLSSGEDITARKIAEMEREKALVELKKALEKVKVLSGLLPICASCKRIRRDEGYWVQVETYIREHTNVEFTHSICPDCMKKLYPEIAEKVIKRK